MDAKLKLHVGLPRGLARLLYAKHILRRRDKETSFFSALDACSEGVTQQAVNLFNQRWNDIRFNTYIASISEHDGTEDQHGRLSMWRAFGNTSARVALVFTILFTLGSAQSLNLLLSPVAYFTDAQVEAEIQSVINNIESNSDFLRSTDRTMIIAAVFYMLLTAVVCMKHDRLPQGAGMACDLFADAEIVDADYIFN